MFASRPGENVDFRDRSNREVAHVEVEAVSGVGYEPGIKHAGRRAAAAIRAPLHIFASAADAIEVTHLVALGSETVKRVIPVSRAAK